ncbi:MAG: haloalkane dehalogenase [Candidatus Binatota bacterium]|nr:haloalkane dehalogenase [Candidatus Binatota bacterium]
MIFFEPPADELSLLRADPLLWEQELDVRPEVAEAIEKATGKRAGRVWWRSGNDHLYALELADLGRGRPSMAIVHGFWERWEPRPPEHEIDADLLDLSLWVAEVSDGIDPADVHRVAKHAGLRTTWPADLVLRTPDERFRDLPDFAWEPRFIDVEGLRMAYVEDGAGDPILMLHGEPTWGFLYRFMIPPLAQVGRVVVPDLIGFGRSDKPRVANAYTYRSHARWLRRFVEALDLRQVTLLCQDWGGLLGLRLLSQVPERFARVVAMNTGFPTGGDPGAAFRVWRRYALGQSALDVPALMKATVKRPSFTDHEAAAYGAPFPSPEYQTGALAFPRLVPIRPADLAAYENRRAAAVLRTLDAPVLLPWADADPITGAWEPGLRSLFRNVAPPLPVRGAGHFLQEDAGEEIAGAIRKWLA